MTKFGKNEEATDGKMYTVTLSHKAIRSLVRWLPKNYDSDDETRMECENALYDAVFERMQLINA